MNRAIRMIQKLATADTIAAAAVAVTATACGLVPGLIVAAGYLLMSDGYRTEALRRAQLETAHAA